MPRTSDSRARLIATGRRLFYLRGHNAVGVNDICMEANVRKGSFYHFFPSKRDLILAVVDAEWDDFVAHRLQPLFDGTLSPFQRIQGVFHFAHEAQCRVKDREGAALGCPFGNVAQELATNDPVIRERMDRLFVTWTGYFEGAIVEAIEAGELPADIDAARASQALLAYLEGVLLLAKTLNTPDVVSKLTPTLGQLASLCLNSERG